MQYHMLRIRTLIFGFVQEREEHFCIGDHCRATFSQASTPPLEAGETKAEESMDCAEVLQQALVQVCTLLLKILMSIILLGGY